MRNAEVGAGRARGAGVEKQGSWAGGMEGQSPKSIAQRATEEALIS